MIGQLQDASIDIVCSSPLIGCEFELRETCNPHGDRTWDFKIMRADGTLLTLHPEWSKAKFNCEEYGVQADENAIKWHQAKRVASGNRKWKTFRESLGSKNLRFDTKKKPSKKLYEYQ